MFSSLKGKQESYVTGSSHTDNGSQYHNLCLNSNDKCSYLSPVQSHSKSYNDNCCDATVFENCEEKEKQQFLNFSSKASNFANLNDEVGEREAKKLCNKDSSSTTSINKSTLSLHIVAYENFGETTNDSEDTEKEDLKKAKSRLMKKSQTPKQIFSGSASKIQNTLEFPRQQGLGATTPEVMQFKAQQKVADPNNTTSSPPLFQEVPRRYVEQIQTTLETMRRRGISVYDGVFRLANRSSSLIEKTREHVEPMAYDVKDFVVGAVNNTSALNEKDRDLRNNLLEMYLGISVLCVGLSAGIISGATFFGYIYSTFVNPFVELISLFGIPTYAYMRFRKNAGIDETERRVWLFGLSYFIGSIIGHAFGARLISTVPSVLFIAPLVLALLIDFELGPRELFADRQRLMIISGGISSIVSYVLAYFASGFALAPIFAIVAMSGLLWIHFQVTLALDKKSTIVSTDIQFGYIIAALLIQVVVAILFGNSHFGEPVNA